MYVRSVTSRSNCQGRGGVAEGGSIWHCGQSDSGLRVSKDSLCTCATHPKTLLQQCFSFLFFQKSNKSVDFRLSAARKIHLEVCSLLLKAYESLQHSTKELSELLPERIGGVFSATEQNSSSTSSTSSGSSNDCSARLERITAVAKVHPSSFSHV